MLDAELIRAEDAASRRLMVVLHGLGDSMEGYRWVPSVLALPWMNYLLVNAPDSYFGGFSWYDFAGDAEAGITRSRAQLFELLDEQRRRGYAMEETTLFGFSQGCVMSWEMGLYYPARFAGLVGISGYVHDPDEALRHVSTCARAQRFLITHGTADPLIPCRGVGEQIRLLQESGLQVEWHPLDKEHTIAGREEIDLIRRFVLAGYDLPR